MPGRRDKHKIYGIILLTIIAGCAKISAPSGGPKDRVPPIVVKSDPENGAKNFKGDEVSVTFNEYVVLEKINEKFMVSPPMNKKPKIFLRGKSVHVQYEEALRDSTTYTFYFLDAIRDLNEGNALANYQFVFSTGPIIDSLSVTGDVYNALSLDAPEETLVLLYSSLFDSAVVKRLPDYISRVDKNGYFRIDNVRAGKYRLYALKDADNSKNFNLPDEQIAFLKDTIEVSAQNDYIPVVKDTVKIKPHSVKTADTTILKGKYKLILFKPPKTAHYLTSSNRSRSYKLTYTLSLPPDSTGFGFSIPEISSDSYYIERSRNNDSIQVWITDSSLYVKPQIKTLVRYPFTDSTGKVIQKQDSITMRFLVPKETRAKPKKQPLTITSNLFTGSLRPGQQISFNSQTPLVPPDTSKISLYEGGGATRVKIPFTFIPDTVNSCRMFMTAHIIQGKDYLFTADSRAFRNIYGDVSDSSGYKISMKNNDAYGKLTLYVKNYVGKRIIQLLSKEEKPLREIKMEKDGKIEFSLLEVGEYRLRVIYDLNGDGKWTTGDFKKGIQPEPVSFFPMGIHIKENRYETENWDIGELNIKTQRGTTPKNQNGQ
jgi:uncharacterized protein (DUF2141 family)